MVTVIRGPQKAFLCVHHTVQYVGNIFTDTMADAITATFAAQFNFAFLFPGRQMLNQILSGLLVKDIWLTLHQHFLTSCNLVITKSETDLSCILPGN